MAESTASIAPLASERAGMLEEVRAGLSLPQKELPPTYFYDQRGSELFEEITRLPEYYLTRAELALLKRNGEALVRELRPETIVELGAGNSPKTRLLLDALRDVSGAGTYVPVDVSTAALSETAATLVRDYPALAVVPMPADIRSTVPVPDGVRRPLLVVFLGSTLGNFTPPEAVRLLSRVRAKLRADDRLLLGVDLIKDERVLAAAYNDAAGVTAEFNVNVLHVLNRELGADFDVTAFRHQAFYNAQLRRIEMHLVSVRAQRVCIPAAGEFDFDSGETIRTEISCKYDRDAVVHLFAAAKLSLDRWIADDPPAFALALGSPA